MALEIAPIIMSAIRDVEVIEGKSLSHESKLRLIEDMTSQIAGEILAYIERDKKIHTWNALTDVQKNILRSSAGDYGTTVGTWEESKMLQADELFFAGYITRGKSANRSIYFHITIEGRKLLKVSKIE